MLSKQEHEYNNNLIVHAHTMLCVVYMYLNIRAHTQCNNHNDLMHNIMYLIYSRIFVIT